MTDRYLDFMVARAKGGTALLVTEGCLITPRSEFRPNQIACYDDSYIPGLRRLTESVHAYGCKIALQITMREVGLNVYDVKEVFKNVPFIS